MSQTAVSTGRHLDRRTVLRGLGVSMGLPWLTAMQRSHARTNTATPRRFVAVTLGLGLHAENLFPKAAGRDYQSSRYLEPVQDLRDKLTVVSGTSHPGVSGGHRAEASILTATPMGSAGRSRNTISIDQLMAKHLGDATRFPSLVLSITGGDSPSYTENGSMIPAESSARKLFMKLFVNESESQREQQAERIRQGRSIMDLVADDARALQRELGVGDRDRLDAYFTSVRDLEIRMSKSEKWATRPKPDVGQKPPQDIANPSDLIARQKTMYDVIRLAFKTDSTRFVTVHTGGAGGVLPIAGVDEGYHSLSHHGRDEDKLSQLAIIETAMVAEWGNFLRDLATTEESEENLLDRTSVLLTSNLGNASNHSNRNMPVLLAGGGFQHAGHLAFDQNKNYPLPNLYLSILQKTGLEIDRFSSSTGTMQGLS